MRTGILPPGCRGTFRTGLLHYTGMSGHFSSRTTALHRDVGALFGYLKCVPEYCHRDVGALFVPDYCTTPGCRGTFRPGLLHYTGMSGHFSATLNAYRNTATGML